MLRAKGVGLVASLQLSEPAAADLQAESTAAPARLPELLQVVAVRSRPTSGGSWSEQLDKAVKGRPLSGGSWSEQLERAKAGRPEIGPPILINTTLGPLALENHKCIAVAGKNN